MTERFRKWANKVSEKVGTHWAFGFALGSVVVWAACGPLFHYSDGWQLTINTSTTIITFLMVFLIQTTQNRDARAIHLKLDELIRSTTRARNLFADLEDATDDELKELQGEFRKLRARASARQQAKLEQQQQRQGPKPGQPGSPKLPQPGN